jgi:GPH family glycoside/pentoside/hexuronide:cation symporter
VTATTRPEDRVPTVTKMFHGLGSIAYGVKDNGFSTFLLIFYNQVIGLDAGLVGTAIMLALVFDAFVDPLIGHASDRTRSRWGRRLPWLYLAPVPLGLCWLLLWYPPQGNDALTLAWLVGTAIVVRTLVSCCEVPSVALVPELTRDYDERTALMRYRFLFGWAGGLVLLILAYAVFLQPTPDYPSGLSNPDGYHAYALCGAMMIVIAVLASARGQHRRVVSMPAPPAEAYHGSGHLARDIRETLSNRAFLWLAGSALFGYIAQGITFSMNNYLLGYVWRLSSTEMTAYAMMLFGTMIAAFFAITPLSRRLGKRQAAVLCGLASLLFNSMLYLSQVLGLLPIIDGLPSRAIIFAMVFFANSCSIGLMILSSSMVADVVEASQEETGRRSEGLFYAGFFFMQKCATGIGIFVAGMILSTAGFPEGARPGAVDADVLVRMILTYIGALAVIGLIGITLLRRFPITREDHTARLAALDAAARVDPDGSIA